MAIAHLVRNALPNEVDLNAAAVQLQLPHLHVEEEEEEEELAPPPTDVEQVGGHQPAVRVVLVVSTVNAHLVNHATRVIPHWCPQILPLDHALALELPGVMRGGRVAWTGHCAGLRSRNVQATYIVKAMVELPPVAIPTTAEGQSNSPGITITKLSASTTVEISRS